MRRPSHREVPHPGIGSIPHGRGSLHILIPRCEQSQRGTMDLACRFSGQGASTLTPLPEILNRERAPSLACGALARRREHGLSPPRDPQDGGSTVTPLYNIS